MEITCRYVSLAKWLSDDDIHIFVVTVNEGRRDETGDRGDGGGILFSFFPKQVYLWGSILEKNRLDTLVGAQGLVGRGFGPAGRAGLGWAWGLAVLGALAGLGVVLVGRGVGRGVWPCWAR